MSEFEFDQFKRNIYFHGKLLTVDDFDTEQEYFRLKNRLTNKYLHGKGIVHGLTVISTSENTIEVSPGFAIDSDGNEIIVSKNMNRTVDEEKLEQLSDRKSLFLCIDYKEDRYNEFPITLCGEKKDMPSRMEENFKLNLFETPGEKRIKLAKITKENGKLTVDESESEKIKSNLEIYKELSGININAENVKPLKDELTKISIDLNDSLTDVSRELTNHKINQHFNNKESIVAINNSGPDNYGKLQFSGENIEFKSTESSIIFNISPKILDPIHNGLYVNDLIDLKFCFDNAYHAFNTLLNVSKNIDNSTDTASGARVYLSELQNILTYGDDFFKKMRFELEESFLIDNIENTFKVIGEKFKEVDRNHFNNEGILKYYNSMVFYNNNNVSTSTPDAYKFNAKEINSFRFCLEFLSVYNKDIFKKKSSEELYKYRIGIKKLNNISLKMLHFTCDILTTPIPTPPTPTLPTPTESTKPPEDSPDKIVVIAYEHKDYGGSSQRFTIGNYPKLSAFKMNDKISSFKIDPGYRVIGYIDENYKGASRIFEGDIDFVGKDFNDKISSLEVKKM